MEASLTLFAIPKSQKSGKNYYKKQGAQISQAPFRGRRVGMPSAEPAVMREPNDLVPRAHKFALASIRFVEGLPKTSVAQAIGKQFLESSTAVNANYKAAKRGRSTAEFIAKLGTVVEEIDESVEWLEVLRDARIASDPALLDEAQQLRRISGKSLGTARRNRDKRNKKPPPDSPPA